MLSIIFGAGVLYYYKDYIYNKYLDIVNGYIRIKCNYYGCNKMHLFTHEKYIETIQSYGLNTVYCDSCLEKKYNDCIINKNLIK